MLPDLLICRRGYQKTSLNGKSDVGVDQETKGNVGIKFSPLMMTAHFPLTANCRLRR